jgi:hypothetical protein
MDPASVWDEIRDEWGANARSVVQQILDIHVVGSSESDSRSPLSILTDKKLGDCSRADLLRAATHHEMQSQKNLEQAAKLRRLVDRLDQCGAEIVADVAAAHERLSEQALDTLFGTGEQ